MTNSGKQKPTQAKGARKIWNRCSRAGLEERITQLADSATPELLTALYRNPGGHKNKKETVPTLKLRA